jgi:hypothetical protein
MHKQSSRGSEQHNWLHMAAAAALHHTPGGRGAACAGTLSPGAWPAGMPLCTGMLLPAATSSVSISPSSVSLLSLEFWASAQRQVGEGTKVEAMCEGCI